MVAVVEMDRYQKQRDIYNMRIQIDPANGGLIVNCKTRAYENIKVELLADSVSTITNRRLVTARLVLPRFVLAELLTHRAFSRNSASSRAVPVRKIISQVWNNPAETVHWGSRKKGMQAGDELTGWRKKLVRGILMGARYPACAVAWVADMLGAHKQTINRILEYWVYTNVLVTTTEYVNWNSLRVSAYAEPNIAVLAYKWREAMLNSTPRRIGMGEWHIPKTVDNLDGLTDEVKCDLAIGRCAAESYYNFDKEQSIDEILKRTEGLRQSKHMSPLEHCATPIQYDTFCGNLRGWEQTRKRTPGEAAETKPWIESNDMEWKERQLGGAKVVYLTDDGKVVPEAFLTTLKACYPGQTTEAPFEALAGVDVKLAEYFGISVDELIHKGEWGVEDAHAVRAASFLGIPLKSVGAHARRIGKEVNMVRSYSELPKGRLADLGSETRALTGKTEEVPDLVEV